MTDPLHHLPLHEIVVFLVAAGLLIPLGQRLRLNPVLGYLLLGVVLGPHALGRLAETVPVLGFATLEESEGSEALAELGVLFLLFTIGLELSLKRLWSLRRLVVGLGGLQVALSAILIALVAFAFGNPGPAALVIGLCLALSSTAIVMGLLAEGAPPGGVRRASFAILLCQDLAVVPILLLTALLGGGGDGGMFAALLRAFLTAALAIALILGLGRLVLRPLFDLIGGGGRRDLLMAATLLVIVLTALATSAAGLSAALGAFLAGLLLGETAWRHEIEIDLEPFKNLLLGLFFLSIGLKLDLGAAIAAWPWLLLSLPGLILLKSLLIVGLGRLFGLTWAVAVETGLLLGQGGEFAFIVIALARGDGLIPADTAAFMQTLAGLSMLITPPLAVLARRAGGLAARLDEGRAVAAAPVEGAVLIAGYGRIGRLLASLLQGEAPVLALDRDAGAVAEARADGVEARLGDAGRAAFLRRAGAGEARVLVVTMDDKDARAHVIDAARRHWPDLPLVVRARDAKEARLLRQAEGTEAVPETLGPALELGEALLRALGTPEARARPRIKAAREAAMRGGTPPRPEAFSSSGETF